MTIEAIKYELDKLNSNELDAVRAYLHVRDLEEDAGHLAESTRRLNITDQAYWIPIEDAVKHFEDKDASEEKGEA